MFIIRFTTPTDQRAFSTGFLASAKAPRQITQLRGEARVYRRRQDAEAVATKKRAKFHGQWCVENLWPV